MSNNLTDNVNMLSPLGFRLTINSQEYANVEYFCTSVAFPSITMGEIPVRYRNFPTNFPDNSIDYTPLSVEFIVDEEMRNYLEIYRWMKFNVEHQISTKDMTLSILSNRNLTNKQTRFIDAFPTNLAELQFDIKQTDFEYLSCVCEFSYSYYEFI